MNLVFDNFYKALNVLHNRRRWVFGISRESNCNKLLIALILDKN